MKKYLLFFLIYLIAIVSFAEPILHDADGNAITSSSFKNKWVIINYWADWCDSCIEEIPELNQFFINNNHKDILIYGVNYDQLPIFELKKAIRQMGIQFPVLLEDPTTLWHLGEISAIPMTFIIDPNGKLVKRIVGQSTEQALITATH